MYLQFTDYNTLYRHFQFPFVVLFKTLILSFIMSYKKSRIYVVVFGIPSVYPGVLAEVRYH